MEAIVWTDKFSVGHQEMDEQHKRLINLYNNMLAAQGAEVQSELFSELLQEMLQYALAHFKKEEKLMEAAEYADLPEHKKRHKAFFKQAADFCTATTAGVPEVPEAMLAFLKEWWTSHILEEDMKYKAVLQD